MCAGDPMERVEISKRGVVLRFYAAPPGRLIQIVGLEAAQKMTGVETELFIKKGEIVPKLRTDGSRTGWMIVRAKDREAAVARANLVSDIVKFETVPI